MNKDIEVGVKLTADGKSLVGESRAGAEAFRNLGDAAKTANNESAAAAERFTANLRRQADTLGMTASQVRAYDAAQLKLNDAQRASVEASNRQITAHEQQQAAARSNIDVMGKLQSNLVGLAAGYVSVSAAMAGGKALINTALANERLNNTLKVGVGSAEAAAQEIAFLRKESEQLGLQFAAVSGQYAKLTVSAKGTKLEGQATREIFLAMAQASAVLGLSQEQTGRAFVAVQQMMNKGKVSAEEFTGQLSEAMPGALQAAASGLDLTERELLDLMATGKLATDRLIPALTKGLNEMFSAQAQEAAQGLNAKINRLDNSFTDLKTTIGNTGLIDLLSDGIVLATRFVDALSGAKVLSAVDAQKQKIVEMREELESLGNRKHIPLIGDLLFDKKQADLLSQRIDDGIQDLKKLEQAAQESAEALSGKKAVTPGTKPELPKEFSDALEKQAKERQKAAEAAARETERAIQSSQKYAAALQLETDQIGKSAAQKKLLAAATEAAKAPTQELAMEIMASAQAFALATDKEEALKQAEKDRLETIKEIEKAEREAAKAAEESARKSAQEWNNLWGGVEQSAKTAFIQFAAHGKNAMESIGQSLKVAVIDALYQLTVRKWMINIGASLESSFIGAAGTNAASSGMNALNVASLTSNGLGLLKSGFGATSLLSSVGSYLPGSAGSFFAGMGVTGTQAAAQAGASALWGASGASTAASLGASVASFAGPAIAIAAVDQITRMLAGDKLIGGGVGKVLNYVPVLGPLLNGLFGRGPLKQRGTSLTGEIGADGFESGQIQTRFVASGGLFRSDKTDFARVDMTGQTWTDNRKLQGFADDLAKTAREVFGLINDTTKQTSASLRQIGKDLGVSTEGIDKFGYSINLLSDKGKMLSEEQIGKEIEKITDGLARSLLPQVDELAKRGETALQTVSRLGTEFNSLVDAASLILGKSAADAKAMISGTTFQGRTAFVDAAGGTDALGQKAAFYSQNFYSGEELLTKSQARLGEQLQTLGLSTDLTKDQFKGLVESFGQVNGISESLLQSLLNLAPAFVAVRNAQEQQAAQVQQQRFGLETQLLQLQGNTVELRNRELAALDPANRELQQRIYLIEDERAAVQRNKDAAATAFGALQKAIGAERDKITKDYEAALQRVNGHIDSVTLSIGKLKSLSDALKATASQIMPMTRDAAKRQIMDAISTGRAGGELPGADSLREALSTLGRGAPGFTGSFEYAREQAKTALLVADLGNLANDQLTLDERSLAALEGQRDDLIEGFKRQIEGLDGMLAQGQAQIDALNGINAGVLTLADATSQFNVASVAAGGATIGATRSGITYQQIRDFANTPGRTGMEIYNAADKNGVGFVDYAAATGAKITDLYAWADAHGLPRFAKGGVHSGGPFIVGEQGPEILSTGPARITSNNDLSKLLNNDEVVQQLLALIAEVRKNTEYNQRVSNRLDMVTTITDKGLPGLRTGT